MTPVRLALVGFGRWGRNYVRAAIESGEAEVSAVVSRTPEGVPGGMRWDEELERVLPFCDAVVYAGHPSRAVGACKASLGWHIGKPVLVEKPAGLSFADAKHLAWAEEDSKAFVLVGHQHLFSERVEFLHGASSIAPLGARWHGPAVHDFPALWDYGSHAVAAIMGIRGRTPDAWQHVANCDARGTIKLWYGDDVDRAMWGCQSQEKIATVHAETRLRENSLEGPLLYDGYTPQEPPLTRQVRAFARAVRNGGTDDYRFGAKWAVNVAKVLESADQSSR